MLGSLYKTNLAEHSNIASRLAFKAHVSYENYSIIIVAESIYEAPPIQYSRKRPFLEYVVSAITSAQAYQKIQIFEQSPTSKRSITNLISDGGIRDFDVSTALDKIPSLAVLPNNMITVGAKGSKSVA